MTGIIKVDDIKDAGGNSIISSNGSGTLTYTFNAGSIARAALAADIIDGTKLADDAIDSEHYADGSIDTAHYAAGSVDTTALGADAVTAAKIADDVVNSEHLAAGGIDTEHLGALQVTGAKLNTDVISAQTELAAEPADTDEFMVSDAGTLKRIDYSLIKGGDNTPSWMVNLSSSQSVGNTTETVINFDTEVLDSNSAYDTSNGRFTVPSGEGGKYYVYAQLMRNNFFNSRYIVKIRVNGSQLIAAEDRNSDTGGTTFPTTQAAGILDLSVGDYVEVALYQDSGGSAGAYGSASSVSLFMGYKLIGV